MTKRSRKHTSGKVKQQSKPRILVCGDGVATTGFARVLHSVFEHLTEKYEIHHLAINYRGDPHSYSWKIYPAMLGGDIFGWGRIQNLMNIIKPDLVFILNDLWVHPTYLDRLEEYRDVTKVVLYTPVDGGPVDPKWLKAVRRADRLIFYTQFGRGVAEDAIEVLKTQDWEEVKNEDVASTSAKVLRRRRVPMRFPPIHVIPHGIDTKLFHPLDKKEAKRLIYPDKDEFQKNSFIVLNANRNQPRKRIDTTIKGFKLFSENKPDNVKLYLHMGIEDMGWNIVDLCKMHNMDDRLVLSSTQNTIPGIPDDRLNLIYNACDVGLNTSVGEGWGLCSFEHAATRAPQILPDHSAGAEIWRIDGEPQAELLPVSMWLTNERVLTEGGIVSPESVAEALERLYENSDYWETMADKAFQMTRRPEYSWKAVAKQFDDIFQEVMG